MTQVVVAAATAAAVWAYVWAVVALLSGMGVGGWKRALFAPAPPPPLAIAAATARLACFSSAFCLSEEIVKEFLFALVCMYVCMLFWGMREEEGYNMWRIHTHTARTALQHLHLQHHHTA